MLAWVAGIAGVPHLGGDSDKNPETGKYTRRCIHRHTHVSNPGMETKMWGLNNILGSQISIGNCFNSFNG